MNPDEIIVVMRDTLHTALLVAAPLLGAGMFVGLLVAVFQAATQIQESALAFVPKLVAMGGALVFLGPWILNRLLFFTTSLLHNIALLGPGITP